MRYQVRNGNRLRVPKRVNSHHFLYQAEPKPLDAAALDVVVSAVKCFTLERRLHASEVEIVSRQHLGDEAAAAFARLEAPLLELSCAAPPLSAEILVCHQAFPHTDATFAGIAFLSVVLHTGPEDYVLQAFHVQRDRQGLQDVVSSSRVLQVGDWCVFDPTTPHMAAPLAPHQDSLLILMQLGLRDEDREARRAILKELPPRADDVDIQDFTFL